VQATKAAASSLHWTLGGSLVVKANDGEELLLGLLGLLAIVVVGATVSIVQP
jgi:hypothetical protein